MDVSLVIKIGNDGRVEVSGPVHDKILCYGILEIAKDVVRQYDAKNGVIVPGFSIPQGVKAN